tara:strand:+ start:1895 stop:2581 length:687 start_codon:yes stop_codon:yes gene_type:complete
MEVIEQAQEFPQIAVGAAQMETLYGSIAGIVVGASLGGFVASRISFAGRIGNVAASSIQFLIGAGLYGYGLMGRVQRPMLRSATQISGVVIAGMGLGRLLAEAGLPTFGLGAEESDASLVGQGDDGRVVGHAAEGQDYMEEWNADYDYAPSESSSGDDPTIDESGPVWTNTSLSGVEDPFKTHVDSGMIVPGSVDQWMGSAEQYSSLPGAVLGNHVQGSIGNGSVIGQ